MKQCSKCGETKPLSKFTRDKTRKDGYDGHCKACNRMRHFVYRAEHRDELNVKATQYRADNPEKVLYSQHKYEMQNRERRRATRRAQYAANPEKSLERHRRWRESHPEDYRAAWQKAAIKHHQKRLEYDRTRRSTDIHRAKHREDAALFRRNHPGYHRRYKTKWAEQQQVKRARLSTNFIEKVDHQIVFERDDWICQICGEPVDRKKQWPDGKSASLDHIVPVVHSGEHSYFNTQLAHLACNIRKGDKLEF